jgi:hypothetical protein
MSSLSSNSFHHLFKYVCMGCVCMGCVCACMCVVCVYMVCVCMHSVCLYVCMICVCTWCVSVYMVCVLFFSSLWRWVFSSIHQDAQLQRIPQSPSPQGTILLWLQFIHKDRPSGRNSCLLLSMKWSFDLVNCSGMEQMAWERSLCIFAYWLKFC